jgi:hypothetical protein
VYELPIIEWNILEAIQKKVISSEYDFLYYLNIFLNICKMEFELLYLIYKKYHLSKLDTHKLIIFIRKKINLKSIINKTEYTHLFKELCVLLNEKQLKNVQHLQFYKAQKKNIYTLEYLKPNKTNS